MAQSAGARRDIPGPWWLLGSRQDLPSGLDWLSDEERRHAAGLRFEKRRGDWLLGRWTAKLALCRIPYGVGVGTELADFTVRPASDGAPEAWLRDRHLPLALSISHSRDRGLCVLAPEEVLVGCDLEYVQQGSSAFLADYLTPQECAALERLPSAERDRMATLFWAAKESALKSLRVGLRADTRRIHVAVPREPRRSGSWRGLEVRDSESDRRFGGWFELLGDSVVVVVTSPPTGEPIALQAGLPTELAPADRGGRGGDL